jgi:hypothetical protein
MESALASWLARPPRRPRPIAWEDLRAEDFAPAERRRLARSWAARATEERVAMHAFADLAAELAGEVVDGLARVVADEARHTELCEKIASTLGTGAIAAPRAVRTDARYPPRERTALMLVESLCVAESWSAAVFAARLERVEHPVLRQVEREILAEEVTHGRLGFAWLADAWMALPLSTRMLIEQRLARLFATLEARQEAERRTLFLATMTGKIVPRLQRHGVRAQQAWERRHR